MRTNFYLALLCTRDIGMSGWSQCGPNPNATNANLTTRQVVVWHNGAYTGPYGDSPLALVNTVQNDGAVRSRDSQTSGTCFGDSGGPLFLLHSDGTREVLGISSYLVAAATAKSSIARRQ
jgi:hypothetical protein